MNKNILWGILVCALALRLIGIDDVLHIDETVFMREMTDFKYLAAPTIVPHPPLALWAYKLSTDLFGLSTVSMRLVPLIFGMMSIFLVYLMARRWYGKRTALFASGLMAVSFWHILASLQVDIDGSVLTFLYVLGFYLFLNYERNRRRSQLIYTGIVIGLAFFAKLPGIFMLAIIGVYLLLRRGSFKKRFLAGSTILLAALVFGVIFFLFTSNFFTRILPLASSRVTFAPTFKLFIHLFVWGGPLLIGLFALQARHLSRKDLFFFVWIAVPFLIYLFADPVSAFGRYFMIIIPPLVILGGNFLSRLHWKKNLAPLVAGFGISYSLFLVLNMIMEYGVHDLSLYISRGLHLSWNFFFPITGSSGPAFGISFAVIALSFIASAALIGLAYVRRGVALIAIFAFLGVGLAFNVVMVQEYLFKTHGPDVSSVTLEAIEYVRDLPEPLFSNYDSIAVYGGRTERGVDWFGLVPDGIYEGNPADKVSGTVAVIDYPKLAEGAGIWSVVENCQLDRVLVSRDIQLGFVYRCI